MENGKLLGWAGLRAGLVSDWRAGWGRKSGGNAFNLLVLALDNC